MFVNNDHRVTPKLFFLRVLNFFIALSVIQLFHLTVLSNISYSNVLVFFIIFIIGYGFLNILVSKIQDITQWPKFNIVLFIFLFSLTFIVTAIFSRLPYIMNFIEFGMYETRNMGLGNGGWYSYITIFFYPLSIMLAFVDIKRNWYYILFSLVFLMISIDLFILGTRGVPIFVLLFHFLIVKVNYKSLKSRLSLLIIGMLFVGTFNYQKISRNSPKTVIHAGNWGKRINTSRIFDNLKIKDSVIEYFRSNSLTIAFPIIYISQYLSHSIPDFNNMLALDRYHLLGNLLYIKAEYCLVARCDRSEIFSSIREVNPRAGLYQTLYSSLLIDFGFIGVFVIILLSLIYIARTSISSIFLSIAVYIGLIVSVSGVENYIYNGLGLARMLIFFILWNVLTTKYKFMEKKVLVS